jgi:hypothetical protein
MSRPNHLAHRGPSDEVLDGLANAFQPYSKEPITRDDAREMAENLHGFFGVLERWAREDAANGKGPWAGRDLDDHPFVDPR